MMAQKRLLHELLKEDQEPFLLNKYISDRRSQLKRPSHNTSLQLKKPKPIHQNSSFPPNFCKNACFFSFRNTPDLLNSPLFEFASPAKSPSKSPNAIFLHIPARTAALLLEAALRIQKQSSSSKPLRRTNGFGLFGSLFKRLTQRNRKREIQGGGVNGSRKEEEKMVSEKGKNNFSLRNYEVGFPCSYNGRSSSAVWSETNEDKSLDMETSSSGQSDDSDQIDFDSKRKHITDRACCDHSFCESPFCFVLQRSPSSGLQTPEFASPVSSPSRHGTQDKGKNGVESPEKFQPGEEEEKEQCSPVSVLDPPFEDDDDGHENDDEDDGFDLECGYAIVQRAKQQLLYKLRSFEKLAELDPIELEKRMMEQEDEEDECEDDQSETSGQEKDLKGEIPKELKRLVSDLMMEEEGKVNSLEDREMVMRRVCERLELWKEVECNTIDMMIEQDFCKEDGKWKKNEEHIKEVAREVELAIFGLLVEEFLTELVC